MPARLQKNRRSCLNRHTRSNASSTSKHGRVTAPVTIEQLPPPQDVAPAAAEEVVLRLILHMLQNAQKNPRKDVRKVAAQYLQVILARLDQIEGSH